MQTQEDYPQQYEQQQKPQVYQQKQPQQQLITLLKPSSKSQKQPQKDHQHKAQLVARLKTLLHQKIDQVKQAKKAVAKCKQEIKLIGEEVDKEMNKSILKHSKPYQTVSIRTIFSSPKNSDPQISNLKAELGRIRAESKKIKAQIQVRQHKLSTPVNVVNQEKASQLKAKIKEIDTNLHSKKQQKQYLHLQIKMMGGDNEFEQNLVDEEIRENKQKNMQLQASIKQQRTALYELQKEDRMVTQKIRFFEELQTSLQTKKSKNVTNDIMSKEEAEKQMKELIEEINVVLEKRNRVENDRKNQFKSISNQVASVQAKNWEIINKLREIDAWLIKHYSTKTKKIKVKKILPTEYQTNRDSYKENHSTKAISETVNMRNDKNVSMEQQSEVVLVEKKKTYELCMGADESSIVLNDQMLGSKLVLQSLSFVFDQQVLYGVCGHYLGENKKQVDGYKMMPKIRPKDSITKTFNLDVEKGEYINFLMVGIDGEGYIKNIQLITSEGKEFKWGKNENCVKTEQKNIRKYESIYLKGKLSQILDKDAPNYYCLGGIAFGIIYLSPR